VVRAGRPGWLGCVILLVGQEPVYPYECKLPTYASVLEYLDEIGTRVEFQVADKQCCVAAHESMK
jgi:hypothetical protein